jgi:AcrR family transcriptional regulator
MERIADEAELAKGTLYLYYRNRDELLLSVVVQDLEEVVRRVERVATGKLSPDKKLLKSVDAFHTYSHENEFFFKAITQLDMRELLGCDEGRTDEPILQFRVLNQRLLDAMVSVVQQGVDDGMFILKQPAHYVVLQMMVAIKGIMIVTRNSRFPPQWGKVDAGKLLHDTAELLIQGLKCNSQQQRHFS